MDVISLGFSKVFSTVLCSLLVAKMGRYGLDYVQVDYTLDEKLAGLMGSKDSGQGLKFNWQSVLSDIPQS